MDNKLMAGEFLKLCISIEDLKNFGKKRFKKLAIWRMIRNYSKELEKKFDLDEYTASDIVNLALLLDIAKIKKFQNINCDYITITCKKNKSDSWPMVGIIIVITDDIVFEFKAHMDSDIDFDGSISSRWNLHYSDDKKNTNLYRDSKTIGRQDGNTNMERNLSNMSVDILSEVFKLHASLLIDSLKQRYLK